MATRIVTQTRNTLLYAESFVNRRSLDFALDRQHSDFILFNNFCHGDDTVQEADVFASDNSVSQPPTPRIRSGSKNKKAQSVQDKFIRSMHAII